LARTYVPLEGPENQLADFAGRGVSEVTTDSKTYQALNQKGLVG